MYKIVSCDSYPELEREVNALMLDGWKPTGGVSVNHYEVSNDRKGYTETIWEYCQAIVKSGV